MSGKTKLARRLANLRMTPGGALADAARVSRGDLIAAVDGTRPLRLEQTERLATLLSCNPEDIMETALPKRVYLAGPVTRGGANYRAPFEDAAKTLRAKGWDVVDPTAVTAALPREHMTRRELITIGAALLTTCDAVCLLPGWETSEGATTERALAAASNIPAHTLDVMARLTNVEAVVSNHEPHDAVTSVVTPLGTLLVRLSEDDEHPGVLIDVLREDGTTRPLSMTEFTRDDFDETPTLVTRAWECVDADEASVVARHDVNRPR